MTWVIEHLRVCMERKSVRIERLSVRGADVRGIRGDLGNTLSLRSRNYLPSLQARISLLIIYYLFYGYNVILLFTHTGFQLCQRLSWYLPSGFWSPVEWCYLNFHFLSIVNNLMGIWHHLRYANILLVIHFFVNRTLGVDSFKSKVSVGELLVERR